MPTPLPALKVDVAQIDEACVIRVQGELDIAGCPEPFRLLVRVAADEPQP